MTPRYIFKEFGIILKSRSMKNITVKIQNTTNLKIKIINVSLLTIFGNKTIATKPINISTKG